MAAVRGVATDRVEGLDGTGSGVVPANQCRAGESHSIATLAATTLARKPPVTRPQRNSGTASTLSPSRADRFRLSTWKPRIAAAVARPAATIETTYRRSSTDSRSRPRSLPGGWLMNSSIASRLSMERRSPSRSKTETTSIPDAPITSAAASVTWRGRGSFSDSGVGGTPRLSQERGQATVRVSPSASCAPSAPSPAPWSTRTVLPSTTWPASSIRASGSPMADWIRRRSGRAPYAGS